MKKSLVISGLVAASLSTPSSAAQTAEERKLGLKQFSFGTVIVAAGAAAAGPVGLAIGGVTAFVVGDQMQKTEHENQLKRQQELARAQLLERQQEDQRQERARAQARQLALDEMPSEVLFQAGKDELEPRNLEAIKQMAQVMQKYPELRVRLIGHADARGTEGYNQILSEYRTLGIEERLRNAGIAAERIERQAFGADRARAPKGDLEGYSLDRRVTIELIDVDESRETNLAKAH